MENIARFLDGAKVHIVHSRLMIQALGVPPFELFQTVDLFEKKNPRKRPFKHGSDEQRKSFKARARYDWVLILAIHSFSRYAAKANRSLTALGPKLADAHHKEWDQDSLRAGRNVINTFQYGKMDGSSQGKEGITFGGKKEIDRNYSGAPKYIDKHVG